MHHRVTDMFVNFQQKWVSISVKTVRTNIFAKNCKLHKFEPCNLNFEKSYISYIFLKSTLSDMHHCKTYMYKKNSAKSG